MRVAFRVMAQTRSASTRGERLVLSPLQLAQTEPSRVKDTPMPCKKFSVDNYSRVNSALTCQRRSAAARS
jgi:hypothetical protein